ncbi:MAG: hypothetical protein IPK22_19760 [Verrucomicrobiaceae bacterium]|nr:hypothetical protein [Verrucomicrobiaceae bacterium]
MKAFLLLCIVILRLAVVHAEEVSVIRHGDLSISWIYPKTATLADKEWLSIVFRNSGPEKIEIKDASYRIERAVWIGGKPHSTGSLASGSTYDLFPHCWATKGPVERRFVQPGVYAVSQHPSRYSSALLDVPDASLFEVRASLHFDLTLPDGTRLSTPETGIPFSFRWEKPNAAGIQSIEQELCDLLDHPEQEGESAQVYRLIALLRAGGFPSLTPNRLLRAIDRRRDDLWGGRREIIKLYLDKAEDLSALQTYYQTHVPDPWPSLFDDLAFFTDALWQDELLVPLVKIATSLHHPHRARAFRLLSQVWKQWHNQPEICSALADTIGQAWKRLQGKTAEALARDNDLLGLTSYIHDLGECRDPKLIPILLPYLKWESRHVTGDEIYWSIGLDLFRKGPDDIVLPPTFRIRDEALYAILTIKYGDPKLGLVDLGYLNLAPKRTGSIWNIKSEDQWREAIIAKILQPE